ncbi:protein SRG1-like [Miscanthus floridulus]|uniref:protein SRG1-like n=1 Tax=Miscanthus floridulus TaxID=154761 RepID=UPI00345A38FD
MESAGGEARPVMLPPVQELAGQLGAADDVPARYIARTGAGNDDRKATVTAPVPTIDLARLCQPGGDGEASEAPAGALADTLQSWGLFLVTNHGMEASLMDAMMDASREFFRQPLQEKQKHSNMIDGKHFQLEGYRNDWVPSEKQVLHWTDLWPTCLRDVLNDFTTKCTRVKDCLLPEMAKLLELDDDYFIDQFGGKADAYARFSYYPPCTRPDLALGLKPHSDCSFVTLLMVDNSVGGLQVLQDGVWYDVPTRPHTLLINLGDQIEIMSNGIFKGPVHRVVTNAEKERLSVALFYSIDPEREIWPADKLIDENHPALYKKVKIKEYIAGLYEHVARGEMVIETAKI